MSETNKFEFSVVESKHEIRIAASTGTRHAASPHQSAANTSIRRWPGSSESRRRTSAGTSVAAAVTQSWSE